VGILKNAIKDNRVIVATGSANLPEYLILLYLFIYLIFLKYLFSISNVAQRLTCAISVKYLLQHDTFLFIQERFPGNVVI